MGRTTANNQRTTHHGPADETHRLHRRGPAAWDRLQLQSAARVKPLYQQQQQQQQPEAQPSLAYSRLLDNGPDTISPGERVVKLCACATGGTYDELKATTTGALAGR